MGGGGGLGRSGEDRLLADGGVGRGHQGGERRNQQRHGRDRGHGHGHRHPRAPPGQGPAADGGLDQMERGCGNGHDDQHPADQQGEPLQVAAVRGHDQDDRQVPEVHPVGDPPEVGERADRQDPGHRVAGDQRHRGDHRGGGHGQEQEPSVEGEGRRLGDRPPHDHDHGGTDDPRPPRGPDRPRECARDPRAGSPRPGPRRPAGSGTSCRSRSRPGSAPRWSGPSPPG